MKTKSLLLNALALSTSLFVMGCSSYYSNWTSITEHGNSYSEKESTVSRRYHDMHFEQNGDTIRSAKASNIPLSTFIGYVRKEGRLKFSYKYQELKGSIISYNIQGHYSFHDPKWYEPY